MAGKVSQEIINLYDAFTHGTMGRRAFLQRLTKLAGGAAAATALLPLLENNYARAQIVSESDERLTIDRKSFKVGDAAIEAYAAAPKGASGLPAVIVIHENRGLNPHIEDVTRRIALEGFAAYGVDMLSPLGGTPDDADRARDMIYELNSEETIAALAAVAAQLSEDESHNGKVGAVGFCWGGGMVNALAVASPELDAGVAYYGMQAEAQDAAKIKAAMMFHYAGEDERINAGVSAYEAALDEAGATYRSFVYDGVQHAFNNDANEARYDKAAAELAWGRTISFFKETLSA